MTHICVSEPTSIGSDNGLSPGRRQAIIWTNAGLFLIGTLETNFKEILIKIHTFSFKNIDLKMSSWKWCIFCLSLKVLTHWEKMAATIFFNENVRIPINISLKFVLKGAINSIGSDDGLVSSRWQAITWTNDDWFTDIYIRHSASMSWAEQEMRNWVSFQS